MSTGKCTVREALVVLSVHCLTSELSVSVDWKLHTVFLFCLFVCFGLMFAYIALFSAPLSRLTALAYDST